MEGPPALVLSLMRTDRNHTHNHRQRELRFHGSPTAGQKESTGAASAAAAAAALAAAASGDMEKEGLVDGEGGKRGGMAGFELRFSSSPDEDVEVL